MNTFIALLRGINVGGNNILPMAELRAIAVGLGYENVSTYIQSGNLIFKSDETDQTKLAQDLSVEINKAKGFEPAIAVLTADRLQEIVDANPFDLEESECNKIYIHMPVAGDLSFVNEPGREQFAPGEEMQLISGVLYFYAKDGVSRSKLYAKLPRMLNGYTTVRNLRTLIKVLGKAS